VRDVLPIAALLAYPLVVHVLILSGLSQVALLALILASLFSLAVGWSLGRSGHWLWAVLYALLGLAGLASFLRGTPEALFLPPILINGFLALVFGASLRPGRAPVIERIMATLEFEGADPPAALRVYARTLTTQWTLFFVAVAVTSAVLAAMAPIAVWSLFANILVFVLAAALFALQYGWRLWRYRSLGGLIAPSRAWFLWREYCAGERPAGTGRE